MSPTGTSSLHIFLLIIILPALTTSSRTKNDTKLHVPKTALNFTKTTASNGYMSEEHSVITEDGYILGLFRIVHGRNCHKKKRLPPVLLMHGLLETADTWIDAGPNGGEAYLLSDACFDLWLGNVRGNSYSRKHVKLDPDRDAKFWHFTVDEIGLYDIPATVDYVLNNTGEEKLNYIGFSQGCGTFFIMCSERPEYCDKINLMIALAPASRHYNTQSPAFREGLTALANISKVFGASGEQEVLREGGSTQQSLVTFCLFPSFEYICSIGIAGVLNLLGLGNKTEDMNLGHFPAGTSLKNLARYGQSVLNPEFVKYDYGREKNLKLYGSEMPPRYNLSAVTAPVVVIYVRNDKVVDAQDVKWLIGRLPNVIDVMEVEDPQWDHMDVNHSNNTKKLIFPKIYTHLLDYSY